MDIGSNTFLSYQNNSTLKQHRCKISFSAIEASEQLKKQADLKKMKQNPKAHERVWKRKTRAEV